VGAEVMWYVGMGGGWGFWEHDGGRGYESGGFGDVVGVNVMWHVEMGGGWGFWEQDGGGGMRADVSWAPKSTCGWFAW
jgi:hypothetical protein